LKNNTGGIFLITANKKFCKLQTEKKRSQTKFFYQEQVQILFSNLHQNNTIQHTSDAQLDPVP